MRRILLLSTSTLHGGGYLEYAVPFVQKFLGSPRPILFIPYARPSGISRAAYTAKAREALAAHGLGVQGIDEFENAVTAVENAEVLFVGGGNTFVLLRDLYEAGIMDAIRNRVAEGMPYVGSSAGANVAGPTIGTTNDMPIVEPPSLRALGLVTFNINPHYRDPDPDSTHMGETRDARIREFMVFNSQPVLGLREGAVLEIAGERARLVGPIGALLFRDGLEPVQIHPGTRVDFLVQGPTPAFHEAPFQQTSDG